MAVLKTAFTLNPEVKLPAGYQAAFIYKFYHLISE
jgi:hypothetical protein